MSTYYICQQGRVNIYRVPAVYKTVSSLKVEAMFVEFNKMPSTE